MQVLTCSILNSAELSYSTECFYCVRFGMDRSTLSLCHHRSCPLHVEGFGALPLRGLTDGHKSAVPSGFLGLHALAHLGSKLPFTVPHQVPHQRMLILREELLPSFDPLQGFPPRPSHKYTPVVCRSITGLSLDTFDLWHKLCSFDVGSVSWSV